MRNWINRIFNFFGELFRDDNNLNEKIVVGVFAFIMMVITLSVDIYTGLKGESMPIHEFVYDGFLWIVLGAFGIATIDKIFGKKNKKDDDDDKS